MKGMPCARKRPSCRNAGKRSLKSRVELGSITQPPQDLTQPGKEHRPQRFALHADFRAPAHALIEMEHVLADAELARRKHRTRENDRTIERNRIRDLIAEVALRFARPDHLRAD